MMKAVRQAFRRGSFGRLRWPNQRRRVNHTLSPLPVRKRFARNPYTVTNVGDVWECDLLDVHFYAKYNDNYRYILSVIDVLSKYLYLIPVKTKSGPAVTAAFRSIFADKPKLSSRLPVWVLRIRARNFSIKTFRTCYVTRA